MASVPTIMLCAGQKLSAEAPAPNAWPAPLEAALRAEIARELSAHHVGTGYASASAGAEIVFCEEVLARSGDLHVFLPCPAKSFVEQYVAPAGEDWVARFHAVCAAASSVEVSSEERLPGDETLLRFNNQMLQGLARIHAERIGTPARLLLAWSPEAPAEPGSPADLMDQWPELEHLSLIDLDELRSRIGTDADAAGDISRAASALSIGTSPLVIRAIFFADMATYTAFHDDQVSALWDFFAHVQQSVEARAKPPILINTWGDAVHAVTETAIDLADYASALVDAIAGADVAEFGLERRPAFRIALHAGPVFVGLHPLTGRSMIFGHHVNRAARIETVASAGEIYASRPFVALLQAEMDALLHEARLTGKPFRPPYRPEYVGLLDLPKKFGQEAIYRIVPTQADG